MMMVMITNCPLITTIVYILSLIRMMSSTTNIAYGFTSIGTMFTIGHYMNHYNPHSNNHHHQHNHYNHGNYHCIGRCVRNRIGIIVGDVKIVVALRASTTTMSNDDDDADTNNNNMDDITTSTLQQQQHTVKIPVPRSLSSVTESMYSDLLPNPNPSLSAFNVVTACMDTFVQNQHDSTIGLDVCYTFSNDKCRAAIGGNIHEFYQYATNPTFTYLTSCTSYTIVSIGPIINGTLHRGAMQTILMDVLPSITTSMTGATIPSSKPKPQRRRFLWTMQQERRPPLQHCWMIHEVLYTKNAIQQTM